MSAPVQTGKDTSTVINGTTVLGAVDLGSGGDRIHDRWGGE
jgi:hypothetical protein